MAEQQSGPLVRDPRVRQEFGGISKSARRRYERAGIIPQPFQLTPGGPNFWRLADIQQAVAALAADGGATRSPRKRSVRGTFAPDDASDTANEGNEPKPAPKPRPKLIRREQLEEVS